jgi:hypothetical protein
MRRCVSVGLALVLLAIVAAPAFAWEFALQGQTEWRYRYWTRNGNQDIFGSMNSSVVNLGINHLRTFPTGGANTRGGGSTIGVFAGENCYGAEMSLTDMKMELFPTFKLNPAISISMGVNLTSLGVWSDGQPYTPKDQNLGYVNSLYAMIGDPQVATNVPNTFVTLEWLKIGMTTPMMDFSFGYKKTAFGIGLWKHDCQSSSTSFAVSTKYGPFVIEFAPYLSRNGSEWKNYGYSRNEGAKSQERQVDRRNYFLAYAGGVSYMSGPLLLQFYSDSYRQPAAPRVTPRLGAISVGNPSDDVLRYRLAFAAKYNNGRFFFNGEVDSFNQWKSGISTSTGSGATLMQKVGTDNIAYQYGAETGLIGGPAKVTLSYVRATGDDPSSRKTDEDAMDGDTTATSCFMKQWGYLMYYMYGTGDGFNAAGEGNPTNFQHVGGRLDYAVAANLNVFGVYSYAWRDQPQAYRLGGNYLDGLKLWGNDDLWTVQKAGLVAGHDLPVPDSARDIGWEVNAGLNWKLLENFTWSTTFAYWQPGTWWSYAYPNTAHIYVLAAGGTPVANKVNAIYGAGRAIDPLMAVETTMRFNF